MMLIQQFNHVIKWHVTLISQRGNDNSASVSQLNIFVIAADGEDQKESQDIVGMNK